MINSSILISLFFSKIQAKFKKSFFKVLNICSLALDGRNDLLEMATVTTGSPNLVPMTLARLNPSPLK